LKQYVAPYPNDLGAHASLAITYSALGQMDDARQEASQVERAVALDPNTAYGYRILALTLNATGRPAEALAMAQNAMRLYPSTGAFPPYPLCEQGRAYTALGPWDEAVDVLNRCLARHATDQVLPRVALAVDYVELGQDNAARAEMTEILKLDPQFSLKRALEFGSPGRNERIAADLRKAGLK
jgi:Flp pilus assembly protein TadD